MGRAGRRLVQERFSLPALAERHEHFYRQALSGRGRPRGFSDPGFGGP
jgi:hypothetical protein